MAFRAGDLPKVLGVLGGSTASNLEVAGAVAKAQGAVRGAAANAGSWLARAGIVGPGVFEAAAAGAGQGDKAAVSAAVNRHFGVSLETVKGMGVNALVAVAGLVALAAYFAFRRKR